MEISSFVDRASILMVKDSLANVLREEITVRETETRRSHRGGQVGTATGCSADLRPRSN